MAYENLAQIITLAASTENTPELQIYWEKRYQDLLDRELFKISSKTLTLLSESEQVSKPATPFGDIVLVNHLDKNKSLDELTLQTTLESAVRFLDSLVDKIDFTSEAKSIVNQYRKIGLGLYDFKDYVSAKKSMSDLDEIDYIGSLVSSGSYRASESLAEEKGVCLNWNKIKRHLRPKSFEYWYEINTGEVKSGLEISEDFDQESIKTSNFEIIPRRNSNILLFPADLEWQIWSDRDTTAPKTEITHTENSISPKQTEVVKTPEVLMAQEPVEQKPLMPETIEIPTYINAKGAVTDQFSDQVETGHEIIPEFTETELIPFEESNETDFFADLINAEPVEPEQIATEKPLEIEPVEENPLIKETEPVDPVDEEPQFQVGELVIIKNGLKPQYDGKVYQVIEIIQPNTPGHDHIHYKLTGDSIDLDDLVWEEFELVPVELTDILGKINTQTTVEPKQEIVQIKESIIQNVHALILKDEKVLLETISNNLEFPGGLLPKNTTPENAIEEILFEKYGITGKTVYEVGSSVTNSNDDLPSVLHLGYIVNVEEVNNADLKWYEKKELAKSSKYVLALLAKLETQKKYFQENHQQVEVVTPIEDKKIPTPLAIQVKNNITKTKLNIMSKYILKLEQLLQTESFGKVTVSLEYDSKGARLVAVNADNVSPELEILLDTVLNLVNFSLGRNTTPIELANLLEKQSQAKGPLGSLLNLVSGVLRSAPGSILEISPDMIVDSLPSTEVSREIPRLDTISPKVESQSAEQQNTKSFFGTPANQ
jgi:hypothetical protein